MNRGKMRAFLAILLMAALAGSTEFCHLAASATRLQEITPEGKSGRAFAEGSGPLYSVQLVRNRAEERQAAQTPEDRLFEAIGNDDVAAVRRLLQQGVKPNAPNRAHISALNEAARRAARPGQEEIIALLLAQGADVNATEEAGNTPLLAAAQADLPSNAEEGSLVRAIGLLLDHGADLRARDAQGQDALTLAVQSRHPKAARALIARGADPNAENPAKYTPLHYAAFTDDTERVRALLRAGANVNARDVFGQTPLRLAAECAGKETVAALLDAGADVNATARGLEAESSLLAALRAGSPEVALLLVEHGANLHVSGSYGESSLLLALRIREFPRRAGPVDNAVVAARRTHIEALLHALLQKDADVNAADRSGQTPLLWAYWRDRNPFPVRETLWVKTLLEHGANANARLYTGRTLLFEMVDPSRTDLTLPLLLLEHGADVNAADAAGSTVLMTAISRRDFGLAKLLIERGANVECFDNVHKTPLLWAAYYGQIDLLRLLLERGANPQARDDLGQGAVMLAHKGGHPEAAVFLKLHGAA